MVNVTRYAEEDSYRRERPGNNDVRKNGCKIGVNKNGEKYISGWKVNKGDMYSIYCSRNPNQKLKTSKSKKGKTYIEWLCSIENKDSFEEKKLYTGFFDEEKEQCFIPDMNLLLDPHANVSSGQGGVWFLNGKKRR